MGDKQNQPFQFSSHAALKIDLRGAGEAGRQVRDSHPEQRQLGAGHRGVIHAAREKAEPQASGVVEVFSARDDLSELRCPTVGEEGDSLEEFLTEWESR
jgi:hypothetical protein